MFLTGSQSGGYHRRPRSRRELANAALNDLSSTGKQKRGFESYQVPLLDQTDQSCASEANTEAEGYSQSSRQLADRLYRSAHDQSDMKAADGGKILTQKQNVGAQ